MIPAVAKSEQSLLSSISHFPISLAPLAQNLLKMAHEHSQNPSQKIPVIGIGGCPGVGKTTIANLLAEKLRRDGVSCQIIHFDDWTNPADQRQEGYFNLKGIHEFFNAFLEGRQCIEKPVSAEFTDEYSREVLDLRKVDLILFEGLAALSEKEPMNYSQYCDKGIFIGATEQDIWKWKRERPCTVQRTDEEFAQHMKAVFDFHHENIEPYKSNATWIVSKETNHGYTLNEQ